MPTRIAAREQDDNDRRRTMKPTRMTTLRLAVMGACAALGLAAGTARADEASDLKAEIQAQSAMLEAQRLRLEALEKKLDAVSEAKPADAPAQDAVAALR